jgi:glutamine amidotransferase
MGWNTLINLKTKLFNGISENEYMYLVHSYYVDNCKEAIATQIIAKSIHQLY